MDLNIFFSVIALDWIVVFGLRMLQIGGVRELCCFAFTIGDFNGAHPYRLPTCKLFQFQILSYFLLIDCNFIS